MRAKRLVHVPLGTRLMRLERIDRCQYHDEERTQTVEPHWKAWTGTSDFIHGTFLRLYDSGKVERVTIREGEGDEVLLVRPDDQLG